MKPSLRSLLPVQKMLLAISLVLYILSFTLNAFTTSEGKVFPGTEAFLSGMFVILGGGPREWIIWFANPLFLVSIISKMEGKRYSLWVAAIAAFLALSFLWCREVLAAESGRTAAIVARHAGYYLWLISMLVWLTAFSFDRKRSAGNGKQASS